MIRLHIYPSFSGDDEGDGGVRRVWEAQVRTLPRHGIALVDNAGDADVIACHILAPASYLQLFPDKPLVAHCHGLYWSEYEWEAWAYKANQEVLKLICSADITTAPSEWVAQIIRRHTSRDVRVINHGVSRREFVRTVDDRGYVLWNKTRIDPVCSPEPFNALARAMPQTQFVTTYGDALPNVSVTGRRSYNEARELVRYAAVYLCTTRETFGIGTLEAMAAGVPVVGFNYGGQAEYIEHGVDGWLAEPGDIDGLRQGVQWAIANRPAASEAARAKSAQFSWTTAAEQYNAVYREAIALHDGYNASPRVSVVVRAYNLERYLPETLDSVIAQTEQNWECVVVDDASPDRCGAIADEYAARDPRFRAVHNPTNQYIGEAMNTGVATARSRYILPLDADDQLTRRAVSTLADALDADRTLQVVYGNVLFTGEDGKTPTDYGLPSQLPGHSGWPLPFDPWRQVQGYNLLPYSSMFRKTAWDQVGGFRRRLKTAEDADFWTRLASYGYHIQKVTDQDTLVYRTRPDSISRTQGHKNTEYLRWYPWSRSGFAAPAGLAGSHGVSLLEPKVSVVIPVGPGHEQLVQDAIDSVAAQTYQNWECIVVNDSGHDLFLPSWVRILTCDARYPATARNLGIKAALAPMYLPLDADDTLEVNALTVLMDAHARFPEDVIYSDFFEDPISEGLFTPYGLPDYNCEHLTKRQMPLYTTTALTPVAYWRKAGGYQPGIGWEDWDFQLRLADNGFCARRVAVPLFAYRKHTGRRRDWSDTADLDDRKRQMVERWGEYFAGRKQLMACSACGGRKTITMDIPQSSSPQSPPGDAVLVEYTGNKVGAVRYRGPSGTIYSFAANEGPKWILSVDQNMFTMRTDFRLSGEASLVK